MNPLLKDRRALSLYLAVCLVLGAFFASLLVMQGEVPWSAALALTLPAMLLFGIMSLSAWPVCRAFPLKSTHLALLLTVILLSAGLSSALWTALSVAWSYAADNMVPGIDVSAWMMRHLLLLSLAGLGLFLVATLLHYLIATFDAARAAERRGLEMQVLARDAELKALRAQVDPHFLFNSLNAISALTAADPAAARAMSLKLADFLRLSMEYGATNAISLDQEFSLALHFLEIEKIRFGPRLQVQSSLDEDVRSCPVPPLFLQPLAENAVTHGIAHLLQGGCVSLKAGRRGGLLIISVENPLDPDAPVRHGNRRGLEIVRQRVWKTYGASGQVEVRRNHDSWRVELHLPLSELTEGSVNAHYHH